MKVSIYLKAIGFFMIAGSLANYISLAQGFWFLKWGTAYIMIGLAEISRWIFSLLAACYMIQLKSISKLFLLIAFILGLFTSWCFLIPFVVNIIDIIKPSSTIEYLIAIQGTNLLLVVLVFYLFKKLKQ